MKIHQILMNNYNIEPIIKIEKTKNGSGNAFFVETKQEKYIAKINERADFIKIYAKVQHELNKKNILQSQIIRTNKGLILTSEGLALYEFIEGDNHKILTKSQYENAIKYIKSYNKALESVKFDQAELSSKNHWDKAKSLDFMIDEFSDYIINSDLDIENKKNIYDAIKIMSKNKNQLSELKKQLIHADLGADNFIFKSDQIISIIDFTPEYNHELYSLCQFIYWNYFWFNQNINKDEINEYLRLYNLDENIEINIFYLLLIRAALYRIIGPIMEMLKKDIKTYDSLKKRFKILDNLINILGEGLYVE